MITMLTLQATSTKIDVSTFTFILVARYQNRTLPNLLSSHRSLSAPLLLTISPFCFINRDITKRGDNGKVFFKKVKRYAALSTGDFSKIFGEKEIPPLPEVAMKLLDKLKDPEVSVDEVSQVIESDPGLSAQVLKIVNSAFYSFSKEISSIKRATGVLGLQKIEKIALAYAMVHGIKHPGREGFDFGIFWTDSLYRALFAKQVSAKMGFEPEEAFTGALLQDIALPVLLGEWFDVYEPIYKHWRETREPLHQIEEKELSWTHFQAGAWMAKEWSFPDLLVCCIGLHTYTVEEIKELGVGESPVEAVALSSRLPSRDGRLDELEELFQEAEIMGVPEKNVLEAGKEAFEILGEMADCFGINAVTRPSLKELLEKAKERQGA